MVHGLLKFVGRSPEFDLKTKAGLDIAESKLGIRGSDLKKYTLTPDTS